MYVASKKSRPFRYAGNTCVNLVTLSKKFRVGFFARRTIMERIFCTGFNGPMTHIIENS